MPRFRGRPPPRELILGETRRKHCRGLEHRPSDLCSQPTELLHKPLPSHSAPPPGQALLGVPAWKGLADGYCKRERVCVVAWGWGALASGEQGPLSAPSKRKLLEALVQPAHQSLQRRPLQGLDITKEMEAPTSPTPESYVQAQMVSLEF